MTLAAVPDLAARRKALGLSQDQLAERAGVSRGTIQNAERGEKLTERLAAAVESALAARRVSDDAWLELARRVTESERVYRRLAEECWQSLDLAKAALYRGMADGLAMARDHHAHVIAEQRSGGPDA